MLGWMDELVQTLQSQNRMATAANYLAARRKLVEFLHAKGRTDIPLRKVDAGLLADYQEWILADGKAHSTLSFHMRILRAVYNKALRNGRLLRVPMSGDPFVSVFTSTTAVRKRALVPQDIARLAALDIPAQLALMGKHVNRKSFRKMVEGLTFARDTFLFCFFACGLPFVDFCYLTARNIRNGYLSYDRHKTDIHVEMEILPQMQQFISRYATNSPFLFPVLTSTETKKSYEQYNAARRQYNHRLKLLSQLLGGDVCLSSHVSRHSWATTVYHNGMVVPYISERLGHTSERTTRKYLKSFESSKIDEVNKRILNSIFFSI
jgi:integrase